MVKKLPAFLTQLKDSWKHGQLETLEQSNLSGCEFFKESNYPDEFLSCNSLYFNCFLREKEKANFSDYKYGNYHFIPQKVTTNNYIEDHKKEIRILFLERSTKKTFKVSLQKSCEQRELPKGIYSAGPRPNDAYIWDNYNHSAFIDRNYISRFQVWGWAKKNKLKQLELKYRDKDFFSESALNLTKEQQQNYCRSQGKTLLESRYFDAATFFPNSNQLAYKYPYHWTKSTKTFLSQDLELTKSNCGSAFVKECAKFETELNHNALGVSWMGIYHSLGSHAESFKNIFEPDANLKVSHRELSRDNLWHKVGVRGFWSGEGWTLNDFKFHEQYSGKIIEHNAKLDKVAFRCMEVR